MSSDTKPRRKARWVSITAALAVMAAAMTLTGALGWWQWNRSHEQAVSVAPEPTVPIADVLAPASSPGRAISRQISVGGTWADVDAAIIPGREVEGTPAEFLVRPLIVDADLTGTGAPATLAVVVGWRPEGDSVGPDAEPGAVEFDGYMRSAEQSMPGVELPDAVVDGATWSAAMSVAEFAQEWPGPLYSAVMVSYAGSPSWQPLPPLPEESHLNLQYLAYSFEWWIFGAFAVFIGARWIRDNGFDSSEDDAEPQGDGASDDLVATDETVAVGDADAREDQS
ncbi:SURF1 family cytochrome oxidase biogenesis protein [Demequina oxidasica]|uniref:SURF1 family cytochrome oxidase biogenesis protein n=1 Tax=Demequina oxidasica TaxID=676199 RepID=UPI0007835D94|nr:SURF1 family cytochrome oxidase biogenesis protein [Demequina oxidasica]